MLITCCYGIVSNVLLHDYSRPILNFLTGINFSFGSRTTEFTTSHPLLHSKEEDGSGRNDPAKIIGLIEYEGAI